MKVLFWNIGKRFNDKKSDCLGKLISLQAPNLICIAEGTYSEEECTQIETQINNLGYKLYYSPSYAKENDYGFGYKRNGLKIFYRESNLLEQIGFEQQRESGRIVKLNVDYNNNEYAFIFIHNFSKSGNREVTDEQRLFVSNINQLIEYGRLEQKGQRIIIIGDFNIEPWDNILRIPGYLQTYFLRKHHQIALRNPRVGSALYSPLTETIIKDEKANLAGTYYSNANGWALYDYPVYNLNDMDISFDIVTRIDHIELLKENEKEVNSFLPEGIDHLPITIELN